MPRFFFDIPGSGANVDTRGLDLPDNQAAREQAITCVRELLREGSASGWDMRGWRLVVTDATDRVVVDIEVSPAAIPE